jgi:hypothetical protein
LTLFKVMELNKMKSMCEIAALIVLLSITGVTTAFADGNVTVTNNTSYTLTQLYASPSSSSSFTTTTNLLNGGLTVLPGVQLTIPIPGALLGSLLGGGDSDSCQFDLMGVLYGATQHAYTYSVDLCDGSGNWTISGM